MYRRNGPFIYSLRIEHHKIAALLGQPINKGNDEAIPFWSGG